MEKDKLKIYLASNKTYREIALLEGCSTSKVKRWIDR